MAPPGACARSAGDITVGAATHWYLTGLIAALAFSFGSYISPHPSSDVPEDREWFDKVTWMDGRWYKQIATEGYHYDTTTHSSVAFFPVYPLLVRALITLTGMRAEAALLVISNMSLLAALAMLASYVRDRYAQAPTELGDYTLLAAALFPTGCFFRLAYSESTCLLLVVLAMYGMLRRWPLWSIAFAIGLATAARPVGVALLAPFAIHIVRTVVASHRDESRGKGAEQTPRGVVGASGWRWRLHSLTHSIFRSLANGRAAPTLRLIAPPLALYLPVACWGLAGFVAYQAYAFGEPLAAVKTQAHWSIRPATPWYEKAVALATLEPIRSVYDRRSPAFWGRDQSEMPWFSLHFANPIFFAGAIALLAFGTWRGWLSLEEISLGALMLLIPYVTRAYEMGMGSMGRFVVIVVPIYPVVGQVLLRFPGPLRAALLALSGFFLAAYMALYSAAYVIF